MWAIGTIIAIPFLYLAFLIFVVGPVDTSRDNCIQVTGIVERMYEGGDKDLAFKLKSNDNIYYINRGLEKGFHLDSLRRELLGQSIILWYAKSWPFKGGHMVQLQFAHSIYNSEWF